MKLSAQDVVDWVGPREVQKAGPYLGRLSRLYLQGGALRGEAQCSDVHPYRMRVEPAGRGIGRAFCSCPVGSGGRCKHVAALLLKYLKEPGGLRAQGDG